MAVLRPFNAIRPDKKYAGEVISLPYDVMNRQEAKKMAEGNPYSFLHICRSEIDLDDGTDAYDKKVYEKARDNIDEFLEKGILIQDEKPSLYIYRQVMNGNTQRGIVGCVSVDDYENNVIKKHELTRAEKEKDRIDHFDTCNTDTEPVFLTYRYRESLSNIMDSVMKSSEPEYDIKGADGVRHSLWVVDDEKTACDIVSQFEDIDSLYIADGHHRSASACRVGEKRRKEHPGYDGSEEFNYFMAVIFPDSDLKVFDYNRVVKDLNGLSADEFLIAVEGAGFDITESDDDHARPEHQHEYGMLLDGKWYRLKAKEEIISDSIIESLDVSILQNNLLAPILRIDDPRTDPRIDFVGGIRGMAGLKERLSSDMKVAFALYPVRISQLMEVSDGGKVMPPKSTWFEPKLASGLFMHRL